MSIRKLPAPPRATKAANVRSEIADPAAERWNRSVKAAASDDATISVLDVIGEDYWMGEGVTAKRIAAALRAIGERPVTVNINSPGGDVFEGLAIYNLLREHPARVTVKVLGLAASAASVIAMAGDDVRVARAGFLMIHNTWVVASGNRHDLRDAADYLEPFDKALVDIYAARTGLDEADLAGMLDKETWIGGSDAVEQGFADGLLASDAVREDPQAAFSALKRLDDALARGERLPRAERRRLIKDLATTPSAGANGMPSAADTVPEDGDTTALSLALARLKLAGR
ncbi:head maturation protease, ClpP-related [Roseomonas xinghualingensis]|uniref:head maturation protease, ClpP-related n=1 Tax=Roseomonas xinghualingensis TaxID=2986475 RepID=UPI0021F0BD94|nr:head maturation protease, ClpP-related [Roseomonas sp. SXEYE001]MCV4209982.1 Clp protease ClpP [Roseomonas sp. SXEYE001]